MTDGPGVYAALQIQRHLDPGEWRAAVDALPEDQKADANQYLSNVIQLRRNLIDIAKDAGCRSLDEFAELRKLARQAKAPGAVAWVKAGRPERWRDGR